MGRNLIIGDIHGMYDRMLSALENANFNPVEDNLYSVGDLCDRGDRPLDVINYLMSLPHFLPVVGNHDLWLYQFLSGKGASRIWLDIRNGGMKSYEVFNSLGYGMRWKTKKWLGSFPFVRFKDDKIILHAGIPNGITIDTELEKAFDGLTLKDIFAGRNANNPLAFDIVWSRDYINAAIEAQKPRFRTDRTIICGHTPLKEVFKSNDYHLICIDTGSFVSSGHITVMDMDSGEFYSSSN